MRILFINLARATDRYRFMQGQFRELGIEAERLEAVDGRNITDSDRQFVDNARRRRYTRYPLTDNEIGCCLSHRLAMQRLADSKDEMITILEDDCLILPDFQRVLGAIDTYHAEGGEFDIVDLTPKVGRFYSCHQLLPDFQLGRSSDSGACNVGYVLSKLGAMKFLSRSERLCHMIDTEMRRWWENGLNIYWLNREIVQATNSKSYIEETRNQGRPEQRERYPDADTLCWYLRRRASRVSDSVRKRIAFPGYLRRGRRPVSKEHPG